MKINPYTNSKLKPGQRNVETDITVSSLPEQLKDSETKNLQNVLEDYINFFMERSPNLKNNFL